MFVVSYPAKVQIFQLITTPSHLRCVGGSCFLPCKGTNFSANHNSFSGYFRRFRVVSYPAKVQIFQLITTPSPDCIELDRCFLPCKGTNFSANHNKYLDLHILQYVVSYPAKVQIFQLITTLSQYHPCPSCCFLPCKGTNFSANHNFLI